MITVKSNSSQLGFVGCQVSCAALKACLQGPEQTKENLVVNCYSRWLQGPTSLDSTGLVIPNSQVKPISDFL
ncbi:hypothetical protein Pst134EA_009343 [Puccinia striiformis f. sp. tritici]|uniref:hypothetical protein n=1 Tax=Puccinia striiformis f. sp. tritici TaxID=168172 RepID=UPI00200841E4|nr:hypothetical protein Pst134EA_009343 [Puccinia striiformis f. sp. tritici]KAH9458114.1 hypothetical protein Pst134EB_010417 [Puccinia striiformis f. sp. tritici]KAH9468812.1 hypothetical protein Pst134EA_009343 [Puccinia striiformis f. sp. tritici]KAI9622348.1 hypothetical protein KEM48_007237 [Puccinia striiformis f. sp. tritici PST-130]